MKILKWLGIGVVVLIVIGALASSGGNKSSTTSSDNSKTTTTTPAATEAIKVSAVSLYETYKENELAADEKYKDKILEISGTVDDIKKDITDTPYVALATSDIIGRVQCMFDKSASSQLANLKKGQEIKITGKCSGLMMNVIVKDSKISQ